MAMPTTAQDVLHRRLMCLAGTFLLAAILPAGAQNQPTREAQMEQKRRQAAQRQRRIIVNNDGNDCRNPKPEEPRNAETFLGKRTSPLVGSQVDAVFFCTGVFNLYHHHSEVTESRVTSDRAAEDFAYDLKEIEGRDSLEIMVDFCHAQGWECFWSMRMNDTHDSADETLLCRWKREHPEYLMAKQGDKLPYGARRWSAVNYGLPEVREKVFRILEDVATRYEVDGLELDFFRHPVYFQPQMTGEPVTQEHCDMMTGLLQRVRQMTEAVALERDRPMLIAVRAPDSLGFAKALGLDLAQWLEEGLIDIVTGGGYFHLEPWENLVALGKQYDVPVYACLSGSRVVDPSYPEKPGSPAVWRGEALRAWEAGVSGIYTFNRFNPRDPLFRELGDPAILKGLEHEYKHNAGQHQNSWLKGGEGFIKLR